MLRGVQRATELSRESPSPDPNSGHGPHNLSVFIVSMPPCPSCFLRCFTLITPSRSPQQLHCRVVTDNRREEDIPMHHLTSLLYQNNFTSANGSIFFFFFDPKQVDLYSYQTNTQQKTPSLNSLACLPISFLNTGKRFSCWGANISEPAAHCERGGNKNALVTQLRNCPRDTSGDTVSHQHRQRSSVQVSTVVCRGNSLRCSPGKNAKRMESPDQGSATFFWREPRQ